MNKMEAKLTSHATTPANDLSVAVGPIADDAQRDEMLNYYWRKGIPSVVLAIVTIVLALYSYGFVQPNVKQRYRDICARNFLLLEGNSPEKKTAAKSDAVQPWQVESEKNDSVNAASIAGSDERRRLLEQTQLCLRRLIIWDKTDDSVRYQSAQVSNLLADWHLDRARSLPTDVNNAEELSMLVSRSLAERKKAADGMRTVQKLDGKFAIQAQLWTARQRLQDTGDLPLDELNAIAARVSELLAKEESITEEVKAEAYSLLAQLFVRGSLGVSNLETAKLQTELQPQVLPFFDTAENAKIADLAWAAEARAITDLAAGQAIATRALQAFWEKRSSMLLPSRT